jgi:uncharacterized protein involved in exopolysaccharide biosynthesis
MSDYPNAVDGGWPGEIPEDVSLVDLLIPLAQHWKLLTMASLVFGLTVLGVTFLMTPTFVAKTVVMPPQQSSTAGSVLASLGGLSGLAGAAVGARAPGDQLVSMLASNRVADRLIARFDLMKVYEAEFRFLARDRLAASTKIDFGKKDGLIRVEVEDESPQRAADMANAYIEELRLMSSTLTITEAQQRRAFFEGQLATARASLARAQAELQASGISESALRAEPKAAAEAISRIRAEIAATEVRLQVMRRSLTDSAPELQQSLAQLSALRAELGRTEQKQPADNTQYISKYREFKYQEGLVEALSRQFELARLDESREGALIQVIDPATVPEWKASPKRSRAAILATLASAFVLAGFIVVRHFWRLSSRNPGTARKIQSLRQALRSPGR